jgi:hypothetical protein
MIATVSYQVALERPRLWRPRTAHRGGHAPRTASASAPADDRREAPGTVEGRRGVADSG